MRIILDAFIGFIGRTRAEILQIISLLLALCIFTEQ